MNISTDHISYSIFLILIDDTADLGILHKVAFCSQPGVFHQDGENFCPLTLRHPRASRVIFESQIDPSRAQFFGQVKPDNVHLLELEVE